MLGEEIMRLFGGVAEPGHYYHVTVDGASLGSGVYYYRIVTDSHVSAKKMLMLK